MVIVTLSIPKKEKSVKDIVRENNRKRKMYYAPLIVCIFVIAGLLLLPTGFEDAIQYQKSDRCIAEIIEIDNSAIVDTGLVCSGEQRCEVRLLNGEYKEQEVIAVNMLRGSLEQDKIFEIGDKALVVVSHSEGKISNVTMIDHYRVSWQLIMGGAFILFLIVFAGETGLRAIFSFVLTILTIWKILVPLYLKGWNPIWIGLAVTLFLTTLIISLVYGFDKRSMAAVSGSFLGILVTCILGIVFTDMFQIHGAVMAYSESLLYAGFQSLDLTKIFMASIFIGSSGAVMDLAVDITSAVKEVIDKKPDIGRLEAVKSGMNVGRAAMGTMTTTLLLAYSGGYIALLMVFMAQGTPISHILNYKYVAAEIIHTVIGSFGLVTVAPFTAICAGCLLTTKSK